ncbi:hypothetical protein ACJ72_05358 [Emergomyces africanus]|uniref:Uncharacterized protein n=1 Tax=Emergomyces africanus TaxID=1955775 RepID=A0A1B7NU66_9EURO|nr:hypothetical protein ACJ72_05358 [Emergomyces africanus]
MQDDLMHDHSVRRTPTFSAGLPDTIDPRDLPSRVLRDTATLEEYTQETREGRIIKPVRSNVTGKIEDYDLVTFKIDDPENPKNWSKVRNAGISQVAEEFHVGEIVALLTITVFVTRVI